MMSDIVNTAAGRSYNYPTEVNAILLESIKIKTHLGILQWLQGSLQEYLPHELMISAWGDFSTGAIFNDIISPQSEIRSTSTESKFITPLLIELFESWTSNEYRPFSINVGSNGFKILTKNSNVKNNIRDYLGKMRSVMVHGIKDARGSHDSLYVMFSSKKYYEQEDRNSISYMLPHIDVALRQVPHLSHQIHPKSKVIAQEKLIGDNNELSGREVEVMHWVTLGKTNSEIGSILNISTFTVKNHMCRVFKKINVTNRAQAVGRFNKN